MIICSSVVKVVVVVTEVSKMVSSRRIVGDQTVVVNSVDVVVVGHSVTLVLVTEVMVKVVVVGSVTRLLDMEVVVVTVLVVKETVYRSVTVL